MSNNSIIIPGTSDQTITVEGDSDLAAGNIKKDVQIFGVTGTYQGDYLAPVAKTGQITPYGTGDDGALQKGVAWSVPRFKDNNNGRVTDNLTGLIWLKNANCAGPKSWNDALDFANQLKDGDCGLSDGSQAGEWRLPNRFELESLLDLQYYNPPLSNTAGTGQWTEGDPFTNVGWTRYWTSSTYSVNTSEAWFVGLMYADIGTNSKPDLSYYNVWPVRGGQ